MKILHTADWHLGQRLMNRHRKEEHEVALAWLLDVIVEQAVDVLIVAGDIFDTPNPPNYAEELYFNFLKKLISTNCRHIVVIGGNHDAPSKLNAAKELLKVFNIHVLGAITGDLNDQILELKDSNGHIEALVAMVPFLRDRDLLYAEEGEGSRTQSNRLKDAIALHFDEIAQKLKNYPSEIPKIVTGHLFATGATASAKQDNIYVGNIENIDAGQFATIFDYVALGHIHRAQPIGGQAHIRYSGSMIPLSFSEVKDVKSVTLATFEKGRFLNREKIAIPTARYLFQVSGKYDEILVEITELLEHRDFQLKPWVEIIIEKGDLHALVDTELRAFVAALGGEVLRIKLNVENGNTGHVLNEGLSLQDIDDVEVFEQRCKQWGLDEKLLPTVKKDYWALKDWMNEKID